MKLLFVCGTRPEVIKLAPVIEAARNHPARPEVVVCSTGQHRQMLDQALRVFDLKPDIDLNVMREGQDLAGLSCRVLESLSGVYDSVKPDAVIVQGDTTSAYMGAVGAFYKRIPVAHVEAGLRTYNLEHPFPEEFNRQCIGRVARWHFAATKLAVENLTKENVNPADIHHTGNTVVDALQNLRAKWGGNLPALPNELANLQNKKLGLITVHRRENFGGGLDRIATALKRLAAAHADIDWVFPVHLNPEVRKPMFGLLGGCANIHLIEPVDYPTMLALLARAQIVVTDSGGLQEEAPSFGLPVVVMRSHTERPEGVDAGFAKLVGTDADAIYDVAHHYLQDTSLRAILAAKPNPYGDGKASARILDILMRDAQAKAA